MREIEKKEIQLEKELKEIEYLTSRHEVLKKIIQQKIDKTRKLSQDIKEAKEIQEKGSFQQAEEFLVMQEIEELEAEFN